MYDFYRYEGFFMSNTAFITLINTYLENLMERIENDYWEVVECELNDGVLNLKTEGRGVFIINRNIPKQELWFSSPMSGGSHYVFKNDSWHNTRDENEFEQLLFSELDRLKTL